MPPTRHGQDMLLGWELGRTMTEIIVLGNLLFAQHESICNKGTMLRRTGKPEGALASWAKSWPLIRGYCL